MCVWYSIHGIMMESEYSLFLHHLFMLLLFVILWHEVASCADMPLRSSLVDTVVKDKRATFVGHELRMCVVLHHMLNRLIPLFLHNLTGWAKKRATLLLSISSPLIDRFSKFSHWHTRQTVCGNVFIIDPSTP